MVGNFFTKFIACVLMTDGVLFGGGLCTFPCALANDLDSDLFRVHRTNIVPTSRVARKYCLQTGIQASDDGRKYLTVVLRLLHSPAVLRAVSVTEVFAIIKSLFLFHSTDQKSSKSFFLSASLIFSEQQVQLHFP